MLDRNCHKLKLLIEGWGGSLREMPETEWPGDRDFQFDESPFTSYKLGIYWKTKEILFCGDLKWYDLTHEMGHVFAYLASPNDFNPDGADGEFDFFGWEWAVARELHTNMSGWWKGMQDYVVDFEGVYEVKNLTPKQRRGLIRERLNIAKKKGLLTPEGRPLAIR